MKRFILFGKDPYPVFVRIYNERSGMEEITYDKLGISYDKNLKVENWKLKKNNDVIDPCPQALKRGPRGYILELYKKAPHQFHPIIREGVDKVRVIPQNVLNTYRSENYRAFVRFNEKGGILDRYAFIILLIGAGAFFMLLGVGLSQFLPSLSSFVQTQAETYAREYFVNSLVTEFMRHNVTFITNAASAPLVGI